MYHLNLLYVNANQSSFLSISFLFNLKNPLTSFKTSSFISLIKYALDGIIGFSISPLKISTYIGFIAFVISIIYMIIVLIQKIFIGIDVDGYATIVCLILMFGSLQMIFIGIIGEYLGRVYIETKKRPIYIIKEEVKR